MQKYFTLLFLLFTLNSIGQKFAKYDSTMKIGKVGYKVVCMNRTPDRNVLSVRPMGFKSEAREVNLELRGRVISAEIDDLNRDGFPDVIIYIVDPNGKINLFTISSQENESVQPIYFPDITNDQQLSKGYRGQDEYKLVEGILFRKFPIYEADTANKIPTSKVRQIMYRVVTGERGVLSFKPFKNFDMAATQ
ncbi:MAG: hypothetical protein RLZ56_923 [Bacteroidota bacterium]|jgi:hypothetical protein